MTTARYGVARLNGLHVIPNDIMCVRRDWVQFKFPKSKKVRIRKKWRKRKENWRWETKRKIIKYGDKIFVPQATYDHMKKEYTFN